MRIIITDCDTITNGDLSLEPLERCGELTCHRATAPDELVGRLAGAEVLLCNKTLITAEVMGACPQLRYIGLFATGYNNVDVAHAASRGITVCNAGEYSCDAVAQFAFGLLLELACRISGYREYTASGGWTNSPTASAFIYPQLELAGKTLGIVGFGSIGARVARIAQAFGMKVLATTRTPKTASGVHFCSLEELLERSDAVTVHCPLTAETAGMFGHEAFDRMKPGALFINTSRGGVVDERALREALDSGRLGGAGLDVLAKEPMSADCPLYGAPRLAITPHVAWAPLETRERLVGIVADCLESWMAGRPINVVSR